MTREEWTLLLCRLLGLYAVCQLPWILPWAGYAIVDDSFYSPASLGWAACAVLTLTVAATGWFGAPWLVRAMWRGLPPGSARPAPPVVLGVAREVQRVIVSTLGLAMVLVYFPLVFGFLNEVFDYGPWRWPRESFRDVGHALALAVGLWLFLFPRSVLRVPRGDPEADLQRGLAGSAGNAGDSLDRRGRGRIDVRVRVR